LLKVAGAFCLATVVVTAPLTCGAPAKALSVTAAPLPATRLEFGLSNFDVSWMTGSGVPWRYRFTYLAGGVNTSGNWFTWQDPAKPVGQYALDYMTSSTAPPASYIPVFTWYQLLQSNPSTGSSELDRDYNNLNNASTMSSYYASFKVLMQKAGQYSRQVVVHVEPDFWGYMQQKAAGGVATSVAASVRSSGFAEAAGFPDNVPGFASELKYLRDTYAPNALLAMHASMWSSSIDIASDTRTTIDAAAEADKSAAFLNSAGAAAWDAVFNDVDDHNAAWWELASCGMPPCVNQRFSHWWDTSNNTFPNFARYMTWVGELHARTLKPQVVWQVPMGNQYFLTMNNTCGHYQDNVAPYFIAHPNDLFSAGLVAVMFGPGNSCQTSYDDSRDDGITNNGGAATSDSLGGCGACNTHASTYADDDGGYIRIFVGNYYAGLSPCLGVSVDEAPPSPQVPGIAIVLAATATGCSGPLFQFWVLPPGGRWAVAQPFSRASTFSWNTTAKVPGVYRFSVWARDANSPGVSGTPPNTYDAFDAFDYVLSSAVCTGMSVVATPAESASVGTRVSLSGSPSGCPNPRYAFYLLPPGGPWSQVQTYSTNPTWSWNTAGKAPGSYRFSVWARDASSSAAYDAFQAFQYSLTVAPCSGIDVTTTPDGSAAGGTTVSVSGAAAGCPNPQYAFYLLPPGGVWALVRGYSSNRILSWSTTGKAAGTYRFSVWARDASSAAPYDAFSAFNYTLT
jgi:hypothetical protein